MHDPSVRSPAPGPDPPTSHPRPGRHPRPDRDPVAPGRSTRHPAKPLRALALALISAVTLALPALLSPALAKALSTGPTTTGAPPGVERSVGGTATRAPTAAAPAAGRVADPTATRAPTAAAPGAGRVADPTATSPASSPPAPRPASDPPGRVPRVPVLHAPVTGPLLRGFEETAGPFGAGHRGVDFGAGPGAAVRAPAGGRVTFAGRVVGATWVTIEVAPAVLVTLGPLRTVATSVGRKVSIGGTVGTLAPGHPIVSPSPTRPTDLAALHLGLRVNGVYVDPLPWLADLARPRLAPLAEPGGPH